MKTRILVTVAIGGFNLLALGCLHAAESLPLKAVNKANEVIDAALEAHGGAEAHQNLHTLVQKSEMVTIATGQSRKPGPPFDKGMNHNFQVIDTENQIFINKNKGYGGGYQFKGGTIINGENSWQIDYRAGTAAPIAEPDFDTQSGPFVRVTPALLLKQLQNRRQTSHWLGETDLDGRKHDVITLVMEVGPALSLYFDQQSHMLTHMERVFPPFGQVEYEFLDYEMIDGIAFNKNFKLLVNDQDNLEIKILSTEVNPEIEQFTQLPSNLDQVAAVTPQGMRSEEIDEGVFHVGGNGTYALFVEMDDHVVAIGGTQTVPASIKELRKSVPDKPIRYGVLTHHHNDHTPGAAAYAKEGATIVTFKENEELVMKAAGDDNAKLKFVEDKMTLSDGNTVVELHNIGPTPHAENILIAYLPEQGIVFEADHFPQPANGVIPPAVEATVAFADWLKESGLKYNRIVGAHSPRVGSPADLQAAVSHEAAGQAVGAK